MSTIVTRAGKGSPLTHTEVDANFTNLNNDKIQSGNTVAALVIQSATITGGAIDGTTIGSTTPSTGSFTQARVNQTWDEGTGYLQVKGQTAVKGNAVAQDVIVQGGNNLLQRSQEFDNAYWVKQNNITVTANNEVAPDGTTTADLLTATANDGRLAIFIPEVTTTSGLTYTISAWLKRKTGTGAVQFYCQSAASGFSGDLNITNAWARYTWTFTATTTNANIRLPQLSVSGDEVWVWGAQLELGTVASPYTPTTSAAITTTNDISVPSGQIWTGLGTASLPSYSILGDTNTGLFSPAADTLAWSTGGSERMRIASDGKVGIGTSSPGFALEVTGTIRGSSRIFSNTLSIGNVNSPAWDSNGVVLDPTNYYGWANATNGGLTTVDTGLVRNGAGVIEQRGFYSGLFTTAQSYRLYNTWTSATNFERLGINWSSNTAQIYTEKGSAGGTARDLLLGTDATERMRITSTGDVGIGTTSPSAQLTIGKANANTELRVLRSGLFSDFYASIRTSSINVFLDGAKTGSYTINIDPENATASSSFSVNIDNTQRVNINSTGQFGIGTASQTALLDVNSDTIRLRTAKTPATAGAAGNQGDICWDADYVYICTATNTWKRAAIATW